MTALLSELRAIIAEEGPLPLSRYMAMALGHPAHGYYMTRDPLGAAGDFTTSPEISQMFGELLGLWAGAVWDGMGRPDRIALVELGPGRGTLMADALRAVRIVPGLESALSVHLVETSPPLRERQRLMLAEAGPPVTWHETLADVPAGPSIVLGNEFLDALPVGQWVWRETGWHERLVGLGPDGSLAYGLAPDPEPGLSGLPGEPGDIREIGVAAAVAVRSVAERLVTDGGAALLIDYGSTDPGPGPTLQAVRRHRHVDPLAEPGEADITAHVDFGAVARAASGAGARVHGPVPQGAFLSALGIADRAERLAARADAASRAAIDVAIARLAGTQEGAMGELFKVIGLSAPSLAGLPALPDSAPAGEIGAGGADLPGPRR
ncbi:class I SAM-dependent methyltransferase [uncultured Enterovirga sp.]|uniref:class I SAM-dependent methyltransferase n=1 Tax=uncultured Enterovirga sp. TaxID=2026352 RepID=UPI0035CBED47